MLHPYKITYKRTPRARKQSEHIIYADSRKSAFEHLCRIVEEETYGVGVPCFVDPLTCEQAAAAGVPYEVTHNSADVKALPTERVFPWMREENAESSTL